MRQTFGIPDSGNHYLWIPTGSRISVQRSPSEEGDGLLCVCKCVCKCVCVRYSCVCACVHAGMHMGVCMCVCACVSCVCMHIKCYSITICSVYT